MSNLGLYQAITTISKKVGGPGKFLGVVAAGGYVGGKVIERMIKTVITKNPPCKFKGITFTVTSPGTDEQGLSFVIGDKYRVINYDGDAIQIEKIGAHGNPYFVSADFLRSISDFPDNKQN